MYSVDQTKEEVGFERRDDLLGSEVRVVWGRETWTWVEVPVEVLVEVLMEAPVEAPVEVLVECLVGKSWVLVGDSVSSMRKSNHNP